MIFLYPAIGNRSQGEHARFIQMLEKRSEQHVRHVMGDDQNILTATIPHQLVQETVNSPLDIGIILPSRQTVPVFSVTLPVGELFRVSLFDLLGREAMQPSELFFPQAIVLEQTDIIIELSDDPLRSLERPHIRRGETNVKSWMITEVQPGLLRLPVSTFGQSYNHIAD